MLYKLDDNKEKSSNLRELCGLVSSHSETFKKLISNTGNENYLSSVIQIELINIVAKEIRSVIINCINKNHLFALIVDETTDISHIEQFSFLRTLCRRGSSDKRGISWFLERY